MVAFWANLETSQDSHRCIQDTPRGCLSGGNPTSAVRGSRLWESELPSGEQARLLEILKQSVGPASEAWRQGPVAGPGGLKLYWSIPVTLSYFLGPKPLPYLGGKWFLVVSLTTGVLSLPGRRLAVWRHVPPYDHQRVIRASVFDTTSFGRVRRSDLPVRPLKADPVVATGGLAGSIDLPPAWDLGTYQVDFPAAFKGCPEIVVPSSSPSTQKWHSREQICILRPADAQVEILDLPWWEGMAYGEHISKVVRDSATGNLIAEGAGRGFLIRPNGDFGGWLSK